MNARRRRYLIVAVALAWAAGSVGVAWALALFERAPGAPGHPPAAWPAGTSLTRSATGPTIVMLVHPRCPCSSASLAELDALMVRARGVTAYVLIVMPSGAAPDFETTGARRTAGRIPGVVVRSDVGGVEARRFGAETSGDIRAYDAGGHLIYSGGVTGSRAHEGDNVYRRLLAARLEEASSGPAVGKVFGCALE